MDPAGGRHAPGRADLAARRRRGRPGAGDPRVPALSQGRRDGRAATPAITRTSPGHGYAARSGRPPRHRRLRRHPPRRVHPPGAGRRARGPRMARRAALVHRPRRHDRASPGAGSTACRSPRAGRRSCRPSSRCARPTTATPTTSTTSAAACSRVDMLPWAATMLTLLALPPGPGDGRRRLARHVARADGTHAGVRRAVARAPAPRRLLAARLGLRGLRARSEAPVYAIGGWADGYIERDPAPARRPARAAQGPRSARGRTRSRRTASPARRSASSRSACAGGTTG